MTDERYRNDSGERSLQNVMAISVVRGKAKRILRESRRGGEELFISVLLFVGESSSKFLAFVKAAAQRQSNDVSEHPRTCK